MIRKLRCDLWLEADVSGPVALTADIWRRAPLGLHKPVSEIRTLGSDLSESNARRKLRLLDHAVEASLRGFLNG
jgi:hypothetical protein